MPKNPCQTEPLADISERQTTLNRVRLDHALRDAKQRDPKFPPATPGIVKLVLLVLAGLYFANGGRVFPGIDYLASICNVSRAAVQRAIRVLRALRVITVHRRSHQAPAERSLSDPETGTSNLYEIDWKRLEELPAVPRARNTRATQPNRSAEKTAGANKTPHASERCQAMHLSDVRPDIAKMPGVTSERRQVTHRRDALVIQGEKTDERTGRDLSHHHANADNQSCSNDDASRARASQQPIGEQALKRELESHGVHGGRARNLARALLGTVSDSAGAVQSAIEEAAGKRNPGAYIASRLDDVIAAADQVARDAANEAHSEHVQAVGPSPSAEDSRATFP